MGQFCRGSREVDILEMGTAELETLRPVRKAAWTEGHMQGQVRLCDTGKEELERVAPGCAQGLDMSQHEKHSKL